jgi:hypothetical protein
MPTRLKRCGVRSGRERTLVLDAVATAPSLGASSKSTARGAADAETGRSNGTHTSAAAEASSFTYNPNTLSGTWLRRCVSQDRWIQA